MSYHLIWKVHISEHTLDKLSSKLVKMSLPKKKLLAQWKKSNFSYKPCDYFVETRCELDDDCKFNHVKLAQGEHRCYTCGDIFQSKRDLINRIKEEHGNTVCYKFLQNKCTVRRCFYKHIIQSAPNVGKTSEAPLAPT